MITDIQPLLEVRDYSFYYLLGLCTLLFAIIGVGIFLWRRKKAVPTPLDILKKVDFKHPKKAAYTISIHGSIYAKGELKEMFAELQQQLKPHKYKKSVPSIPDATKQLFFRYLDAIESGR